MSRSVRVVMYAVNGSGVGHLTRLHGIARWMRRYAQALGVRPEIWFLTSCEADGILFADRFPSFKLPSKSVVGDASIDKLAYLALAKQWVWHSLALLRPDLLVVDTFPRGAFGELLSALDLCRRKAFVYRPTKASFSARPDFQAMLPLYDAIVVPDRAELAEIEVPAPLRARVRHVGPVVSRDAFELLSREEAREELGIEGERLAVLVSAGGGGDPGAEDHLAAVHRALASDERVHLVIGAGPLYRGKPIRGPRVTWIEGPALAERMRAFDLAICAAGYNTFHELMLAGVPAIFLPQEKIADDQAKRAARAIDAGAAVLLESLAPEAIARAIDRLRDEGARRRASEAARALVPTSHARDAASELLRLVLPPHEIDAIEDVVSDEVVRDAAAIGFDRFAAMLRVVAGEVPDARDAERALGLATSLARAGASPELAVRVVEVLSRKLAAAPIDERAAAIARVVSALAPFSDWSGAAVLVGLVQPERQLAAAALASKIEHFLERVRARGHDLYAAIAELSRAQAKAEAGTNEALLRGATEAFG